MSLHQEQLTLDNLATVGFHDTARALRLLDDMSGHDIPDDAVSRFVAPLLSALATCANPDRALVNLHSWLVASRRRPADYEILAANQALLDALVDLFSTSQYLSSILIKNPEYLEIVANPAIRDRARTVQDYIADGRRRVSVGTTPGMKRDALRRFKAPEMLRIGTRDVLGYASLPQTVDEISSFAEACVRIALEICGAPPGFAAIAMGKLGGLELNYASDIDLIFVHAGSVAQAQANALTAAVRDTLAANTEAGFVFRVDLRLRPEGRFGPISRSISSCASYFESWAEAWERQAMIKARIVAGDEDTGTEFIRLATAFAYRKLITSDFVEAIQNNKRLIERKIAARGESDTNVKEGIGGIRDVEFAVQLLQLVAGGTTPSLRTGNTLTALERLVDEGLLSQPESSALAESYCFLRHVEHRLQLMDERPVRNIPRLGTLEHDAIGRGLGYPSGDEFAADYSRRTQEVSNLFRSLFYGEEAGSAQSAAMEAIGKRPMADLVRTIGEPQSNTALLANLASMGFLQPDDAVEIVRRAYNGGAYGDFTPEAREGFASIVDKLLAACSESGAADEALQGFDRLADAVPARGALFRTLAAQPEFVTRLAALAGRAPHLWRTVVSHLEFLDILSDASELARPESAANVADPSSLAGMIRRERLRTGARDVWEIAPADVVCSELSALADSVLTAALTMGEFADAACSVAVIGLGKLGGLELGYGSDLDVLWVVERDANHEMATALAESVTRLLSDELKPYGEHWEVDARLRPDGRVGTLVRTVDGYAQYFASLAAQTWERQALIKARFSAGNSNMGREFIQFAHGIIYEIPITPQQHDDMRHMKRRIETERCKDERDIKLGPGGLSDIEWTTQYLQWRYGARWPKARMPNTLDALRALRDSGTLRQDDWEMLSATYLALTEARNATWLREGRVKDVVAVQSDEIVAMRRGCRGVFERLFSCGEGVA